MASDECEIKGTRDMCAQNGGETFGPVRVKVNDSDWRESEVASSTSGKQNCMTASARAADDACDALWPSADADARLLSARL